LLVIDIAISFTTIIFENKSITMNNHNDDVRIITIINIINYNYDYSPIMSIIIDYSLSRTLSDYDID